MRGWFGAAALVVVLGACGDDGPRRIAANEAPPGVVEPGDDAGGPPPVELRAVDNTFEVPDVVVAAGTEVRWTNDGRNDHDIVPVDAATWGVAEGHFAPGDEYAHVFEEPGTYDYYCSLHGTPTAGMVGTVVVEAAP